MANLLPGALSLGLLASVPGLLEVLGSWITKETCGWYLPILEFATLLGKGNPEPYLGSRWTFWVCLPEAKKQSKFLRGTWGSALRRHVYKRASIQRYSMCSEALCPG